MKKQFALTFHENFANEGKLLKDKLSEIYGLEVVPEAPVTIVLDYLPAGKKVVNEEYYELNITDEKVEICSNTSHGIFNGTQTLLGLLKGQKGQIKQKEQEGDKRSERTITLASNVYSGLSGLAL